MPEPVGEKFAVNVTALLGIEKLHGLLVPHEYPDPLQLENWYPDAGFPVTTIAVPAASGALTLLPEKDCPLTVPDTEYPFAPMLAVNVYVERLRARRENEYSSLLKGAGLTT